jgi:hypothetical protein
MHSPLARCSRVFACSTVAGNATAGDDFTAVASGGVLFGDGVNERVITIAINNDAVYELDEYFQVVLNGDATGAHLREPHIATVTITDDSDAGIFSFSNATYLAVRHLPATSSAASAVVPAGRVLLLEWSWLSLSSST